MLAKAAAYHHRGPTRARPQRVTHVVDVLLIRELHILKNTPVLSLVDLRRQDGFSSGPCNRCILESKADTRQAIPLIGFWGNVILQIWQL